LTSGNEGFNPALKDTSPEEYPVLAVKAFNPYISPQPDYLPLVAATGVLLFQADYITQLYI